MQVAPKQTSQIPAANGQIAADIEQIIAKSLASSFGLDFLLFADKNGGNVNTVHNARAGVYATKGEQEAYENRGEYDSHSYHSDESYISKNKTAKVQKQAGTLKDGYTGKIIAQNEAADLDHIISAKEVHDDAGRVLAGLNGERLANSDENLIHTNDSLNRSKKDKPMGAFVEKLKSTEQARKADIEKLKTKLNDESLSAEQRDKIQEKCNKLEKLDAADYDKMLALDENSRKEYEKKVNNTYYLGDENASVYKILSDKESFKKFINGKFMSDLKGDIAKQAKKMATRQAVGIVLAYAYIEIKECAKDTYDSFKDGYFTLSEFFTRIAQALKEIFARTIGGLKELLSAIKDGAISGALASLTTALINIFLTTAKTWVRIIRQTYPYLIQAIKLMFFNPQNLSKGELTKQFFTILVTAASIACGVFVTDKLQTLMGIDGNDDGTLADLLNGICEFAGALVSGLLTYALFCFLHKSKFASKVWAFIDRLDDRILSELKSANKKLDEYLLALGRVEFGFSESELGLISDKIKNLNAQNYTKNLTAINSSLSVKLPFDINEDQSVREWLINLK